MFGKSRDKDSAILSKINSLDDKYLLVVDTLINELLAIQASEKQEN